MLARQGVPFTGHSMAHHGEIFQGVVRTETGRLRRALCSLPCSGLGSEAIFHLDDSGIVTVTPAWKTKARVAARLVLERIGRPELGGALEVRSDIPPGWGLGSSTADVIASIRAVLSAVPHGARPPSLAALAVQAERASDSTIFSNAAVLFAHREGEIVEFLGDQIPELIVVGFNTDPGGVDTLDFPPARYAPDEIARFADLVDLLRRAILEQDVRALSQVATGCARINQAHLPKPRFDRIEDIAVRVGALGVQVAHSGTVAGLLFDPRDLETELRVAQARAQLAELGFGGAWRFSTMQTEPLRLRGVP
ncbi:MAG TPA: hypothetical protein VH165_07640 [Kofleriaceae bacterium]|nr:hypothetical protein [Kofleriaceae bacterium]